ncbi:hypothetical protein LUZ60_008200 [Juncus effusus]|nr:hypothetical protein LUZ60_008200 [Juncus effusus]
MKTRSKSAAAEDSITNKDKQPLAVISKQNTKKKRSQKQALRDDNFDPRKPKKPPTAFFFYLEDFRKTFQLENPKVKSMRERVFCCFTLFFDSMSVLLFTLFFDSIGKACGDKWKSLPFQEKVAYYDIATEKRAEFEKSMADYIKKKESGELSDESEEEYM